MSFFHRMSEESIEAQPELQELEILQSQFGIEPLGGKGTVQDIISTGKIKRSRLIVRCILWNKR